MLPVQSTLDVPLRPGQQIHELVAFAAETEEYMYVQVRLCMHLMLCICTRMYVYVCVSTQNH